MFFVIELQTNADGTTGSIVTAYAERDAAESAYLTIRNAALQSAVLVHTAVLMDNRGRTIESKAYIHPGQAADAE